MQIFTATANAGNSVIGKAVTNMGEKFDPPTVIQVRKFTWIFEKIFPYDREGGAIASSVVSAKDPSKTDPNTIDVEVMKIDMQGYECNFFRNFPFSLAKRSRYLKMEIAPMWLQAQKCSVRELEGLIVKGLGFHTFQGVFGKPNPVAVFDLTLKRDRDAL